MNEDFETWWAMRGCREVYDTQKDAAKAAWEAAQIKYTLGELSEEETEEKYGF